ncbi:MAG: hypothetical protein ACT4P1_03040 [Sporichthyaceae bacterium]
MRTSVAAVLSVAVVASVAAPAAGAWAASNPAPVVAKVSVPELVQVNSGGGAAFAVKIAATDNTDVSAVWVNVVQPDGKRGARFPAKLVSGFAGDSVWKAKVTLPAGVPLGDGWTVRAFAEDPQGERSADPNKVRARFGVKVPIRVRNLAAPATVDKGSTFTVAGRLLRMETTGWVPHYDPKVAIQLRRKGTSTWVAQPIKAMRWKNDGTFAADVAAPAAGDWRVVVKSRELTMPVKSAPDYVAVN